MTQVAGERAVAEHVACCCGLYSCKRVVLLVGRCTLRSCAPSRVAFATLPCCATPHIKSAV